MPVAMAIVSHDQRNHVAPHFYCLELRNVMVPLIMVMAIYDINISANGMT